MSRALICWPLLVLMILGCRLSEREGLNPLPENAPPLEYFEMINRGRNQAAAAVEAFHLDAWLDLEQAALRLEQTGRLLPKSTHIPEALQARVEPEATLLKQDAQKL